MKLFSFILNMWECIPLKTSVELYQTTRRHIPRDSPFKQKYFELQLNIQKYHIYCQSRVAKVIPEYVWIKQTVTSGDVPIKRDEDMRVRFFRSLIPEFRNKTTESETACCYCGIDSDENVIRVV